MKHNFNYRYRRRFIVFSTKKKKKKLFNWLTSFVLLSCISIYYTYSGIPTRDPPAYGFCRLPDAFFLSIWLILKLLNTKRSEILYELVTFLNICYFIFFYFLNLLFLFHIDIGYLFDVWCIYFIYYSLILHVFLWNLTT